MFSHILIPTDGTDLSDHAVEKGIAFAAEHKAKVILLYVQPETTLPQGVENAVRPPEAREKYAKAAEDTARHILQKAASVAQRLGVKATTMTAINDSAYEEIVDAATSHACDLIIMATHGRHGLGGLLMSSVTQQVMTHCKVPMLVYR